MCSPTCCSPCHPLLLPSTCTAFHCYTPCLATLRFGIPVPEKDKGEKCPLCLRSRVSGGERHKDQLQDGGGKARNTQGSTEPSGAHTFPRDGMQDAKRVVRWKAGASRSTCVRGPKEPGVLKGGVRWGLSLATTWTTLNMGTMQVTEAEATTIQLLRGKVPVAGPRAPASTHW